MLLFRKQTFSSQFLLGECDIVCSPFLGITLLSHLPALEPFGLLLAYYYAIPTMKKVLVLSFLLQFFFHISRAQDSSSDSSAPTTTAAISLTPQMSASAVSSLYSVLATATPQQPGDGILIKSRGSYRRKLIERRTTTRRRFLILVIERCRFRRWSGWSRFKWVQHAKGCCGSHYRRCNLCVRSR